MAPKLGIGVIGPGAIAGSHVAALREHPRAELVAVLGRDPERARLAAERWGGVKVASSVDELVSDDAVDAVFVCTPPGAHAAATIAALEAGKHVLVEKPFALDVGEAAAMVRAAETSSAFLACASARRRCRPAQVAARRMIDGGELGNVYHARYSVWRLRGRPGHHWDRQSPWYLDRSQAGGGVLIDLGVYVIDSVLWMLGNPTVLSVLAQTRRFSEDPVPDGVLHDVEDHAVIMLQCENGKSAVIEVAWVSNMAPVESFSVLGTKAGLRLDPLTKISARRIGPDEHDPLVQWMSALGSEIEGWSRPAEEQLFPEPETAAVASLGNVTKQFLDSIAAGTQPHTCGQDSLQITKIIDAAYRSAEVGASVALVEGTAS